jgi:hypothetical protein
MTGFGLRWFAVEERAAVRSKKSPPPGFDLIKVRDMPPGCFSPLLLSL